VSGTSGFLGFWTFWAKTRLKPRQVARTLVEAGLTDLPSREVAHLRRYERATLRRLVWLKTQMTEAGLQPQTYPLAATLARMPPTAQPVDSEVPASTVIEPPPAAMQAATERIVEVIVERIERNEATAALQPDQTKLLWIKTEVQPTPTFASAPDRPRPDLAKLARRERRKRRSA